MVYELISNEKDFDNTVMPYIEKVMKMIMSNILRPPQTSSGKELLDVLETGIE